jgi:hypothetical protein
MTTDLALVFGLGLALLAVPAFVSAFASDRSPRSAVFLLTLGGTMILYAVLANPAGYRPGDVPHAVLRVIAGLVR